ncbi:MAG: flagellar motor stator protein MotA [Gemmataceae bacterium]|nr:flagellar motor stator protein MotA [Gemmataceae bacterium]
MVVIGGCIFVIVSVLTGFSMAGGHMHSLFHPSEVVTIGGAALGGLIIMSPTKVLKDLAKGMVQLVKGSPFNKAMYMDLFRVLNGLGRIIRRDGLLALESHISTPKDSAVFQAAPKILGNHHVSEFICSSLALIVDGRAEAAQLHGLMEEEIKVLEREHHAASNALAKVADALPGFGIVAAVLGIVVTMGEIGGPVEEIGHKVGAALVGTFLGILLSYGFFAPMAARMEVLGELELVFFRVIAGAVVSVSEGASPNDVISRACRSIGTECRPTQAELAAIYSEK